MINIMRINKRLLSGFLCLISLLIAVQPGLAQTRAGYSRQVKKFRVALVLPGAINDQGFNQSAYDGLQLIKTQLGVDVVYSESTPTADFERVFREYADDGNDIIIGHGFEFGDVATKVSKDYPNQYFLVTSCGGISGPNVASIEATATDLAFLVGVLAGLTTQSNKVGAIAGFDFPNIVVQTEAFRLGMKSANPKADLTVSYIGTFDDPAKGKEAALAQISAGVDVIYQDADTAGLGVIQAADDKGIKIIGWGIDQNKIAPKTVIATQVVDTPTMMLQEVKLIMDGKFDGKAREFKLDSHVVGVSDYHGLVPAAVANQVALWQQAIIAGAVQVPYLIDKDAAIKLPALTLPPAGTLPTLAATQTVNATDSSTTAATQSATPAVP